MKSPKYPFPVDDIPFVRVGPRVLYWTAAGRNRQEPSPSALSQAGGT
jgi:hypothetical protein